LDQALKGRDSRAERDDCSASPGLTEIRANGTATGTNHNGPKWKWTKVDGK
jgi:hypothetical protein